MKKKFLLACLLITFVCFSAFAEEGFWTEGTLDYHGHAVEIHAIVDDNMPSELMQIKLKGDLPKQSVIHRALQEHFKLHPDFSLRNCQRVDDFYCGEWATGFSGHYGNDFRLILLCEAEQLFPIEDPELRGVYGQCVDFLNDLGIDAAENCGYVSRSIQKDAEYIIALLPYQIEGLSTEYKNQIVHRSSLRHPGNMRNHIMDYPWADFVFDAEGQLVKAQMSMYEVVSSKPLSGKAVSWKEAALNVLDTVMYTRMYTKQTLEGQPNNYEDRFWAKYSAELSRVTPMWMPNWSNVCVPGWCIQYQLYDSESDEFVYAPVFCADALTGEVAYPAY